MSLASYLLNASCAVATWQRNNLQGDEMGRGPQESGFQDTCSSPLNEDFRTSKNQFQDILHLGLKMKSLVFKMISIHFMLPGFPAFVPFKTSHGYPVRWVFRVLWTRYGSSMCLCDHLCHGILHPGQLHSTQEVPTRKTAEFWVFLQILSSRSTIWILHFTCALFFSTHFLWKTRQPTSTHSQTLFGETAKNKDH